MNRWKIGTDSARGACRDCPASIIEEESGAQIAGLSDGWPKEDTEAHARLIAQAPALLEALRELKRLAWGEPAGDPGRRYIEEFGRAVNAARAAIKAATE